MIAVSESTPGPMGVNMATYVGFHIKGILGGLAAPLSLVLPSVIIIVIISKILDKFKSSAIVQNALYGLRAASTALIAAAGIGVACRRGWQPGAFQAVFHHQLESDRTGTCDLVRLSQMEKAPDPLHRGGGCDWNRVPVPLGKIEENRTISRRGSSVSAYSFGVVLFCHRKLRPITKRSAGCVLTRRRNMPQAAVREARMCQGT